jgi:UDP-N-acetylglucosamine 4,6-dehydratase
VSSYLITGGGGALGTAFVRHLLTRTTAERIVVFSRGEFRQHQMARELADLDRDNQRLRFFIGDVRDRDRLRRAMRGINIVIHAAALKRIEVGQYNPIEMVKTNVDGAINVIEAAQDAGVEQVVGISSDKAFEPVSPYGHSKAMAESLFLAANNTSGWTGPKFAVCRYGNVWNSTGSVVPLWRGMIRGGAKTVPVTDPDCTRFFMRMQEAVDLIMDTIKMMSGGEMAIPVLPAYRLGDLAEAMEVNMNVIGLPKWEKRHESMAAGNSSDKARRMTVKELKEELRITP